MNTYLLPETLEYLREHLPESIREKWTDEELGSTAYFLAVSGFVPAGYIGVADVNNATLALTTQFIATSLLPPYLEFGAIDPTVIHNFSKRLNSGEITKEQFAVQKR